VSARAGIVVTGTEVLTGRVADRNGPWVAERLRHAGVDVGHVVVVGDRPDDLRTALDLLRSGNDLVVTTGGLGPTADDLTAEVVAQVQGRTLHLDAELERRVAARVEELSRGTGRRRDPEATAAGVRKQALVPDGAAVLEPVGTAPGLVVPAADAVGGPPVVVLPGPPPELQGMWDAALADPTVRQALAGRATLHQSTARLWGTPESELAAALRRLGDLDGVEVTTCLDHGELEVVGRYPPSAAAGWESLLAMLRTDFPATLFSDDGRTIDEIVADGLLARGWTIGTAESCSAGLLAGRLADRPGSSRYLLGGVVSYSNELKERLLGVDHGLLETKGAVSAEVARAMADGARVRLGTDVGVGITGIAGPDGGTPEKPVGLVHVCVTGPDGVVAARELRLGGGRAGVRTRSVLAALHLVRDLLDGG
jgi:nicotinamide-nucleotide amidase